MKNVTIALDEELVHRARLIAAERRSSLNGLIREFLIELTAREERTARARRRIAELCQASQAEIGERTWSRDELHDR